jgi:hypothetical protein
VATDPNYENIAARTAVEGIVEDVKARGAPLDDDAAEFAVLERVDMICILDLEFEDYVIKSLKKTQASLLKNLPSNRCAIKRRSGMSLPTRLY